MCKSGTFSPPWATPGLDRMPPASELYFMLWSKQKPGSKPQLFSTAWTAFESFQARTLASKKEASWTAEGGHEENTAMHCMPGALRLHSTFGIAALRRAEKWEAVVDKLLAMPARRTTPNAACYHEECMELR